MRALRLRLLPFLRATLALLAMGGVPLRAGLAAPAPAVSAPAADDCKRDDVLQLRAGEQRSLTFADLVRLSVGDTSMLVVRRIRGDCVTVEAILPGVTWIEAVHGKRAYTAIRVVIEAAPAPVADAPVLSAAPPAPVAQTPAPPAASPAPSDVQPQAAPSAAPGSNERALTLAAHDFRVGIEPAYGVDTQTYPTLFVATDARGGAAAVTASTRVKRQFETLPVTFDYSPDRRNRITAVVPYVNSEQVTSSPFGSARANASGLGDIALSWEHQVGRQALGGWQTGVTLSTTFPTGRSVYDITRPDDLPLGTGHYQMATGLTVRRIADPLALYGSVGVTYTLPRAFQGSVVAPGLGFVASSGVTWALSDRWALSEQLAYARRPNVFLASPTLAVTQNVDQAYLMQAVTYSSRRGDFLLRLMLSAGLNDASTDFVGGVSAQWRH